MSFREEKHVCLKCCTQTEILYLRSYFKYLKFHGKSFSVHQRTLSWSKEPSANLSPVSCASSFLVVELTSSTKEIIHEKTNNKIKKRTPRKAPNPKLCFVFSEKEEAEQGAHGSPRGDPSAPLWHLLLTEKWRDPGLLSPLSGGADFCSYNFQGRRAEPRSSQTCPSLWSHESLRQREAQGKLQLLCVLLTSEVRKQVSPSLTRNTVQELSRWT